MTIHVKKIRIKMICNGGNESLWLLYEIAGLIFLKYLLGPLKRVKRCKKMIAILEKKS